MTRGVVISKTGAAPGNFAGRNQRDGRRLERLRQALHRRKNSGGQPAGRGNRLHHRGRTSRLRPPTAPFISGFESFQLPDDLDHKSFTLTAPAGVAIHQIVSGAGRHRSSRSTRTRAASRLSAGRPNTSRRCRRNRNCRRNGFTIPASAITSATWRPTSRNSMTRCSIVPNNASKAAAKAAELAGQAPRKTGGADGHPRFRRQVHPLAGPSFTELPLSELSDRGHDAGRWLRPCGGPRDSSARDAVGGRVSAGICDGLGFAADCRHHQRRRWRFRCRARLIIRWSGSAWMGRRIISTTPTNMPSLGSTDYDGQMGLVLPPRPPKSSMPPRIARTKWRPITRSRRTTRAGRA